ncbi:MAG: nucleotide exchange factor GrpE [Lachnospiraceae bacterium]|nr:nucleotide exchange factor GrpE [Lachnospiraceae bacterium]
MEEEEIRTSSDQEETTEQEPLNEETGEAEEAKKNAEPAERESETEDDVADGSFTSVEESPQKTSFFKKKKDKRDEKIEELTDRVKRQMAEFDNFRKRTDKEKSQMFDLGAKSVIEKILPVIDNFERGLAQAEDKDDPFVQGMEKVYKSMLQELESIGVKQIEAEGAQFDPNLHNAVMHCEDDSVGENIIVQELQKGYTYHDTVVRFSMVKVAN